MGSRGLLLASLQRVTSHLKVLFLAPSGRQPGQLSRYSFLDEEMRAIAARGVEVYVVSTQEGTNLDQGRIHLRELPPDSLSERARTLAFLIRYVFRIGISSLRDPKRLYRAVRTERFAARIVREESIVLVHSYFGWPGGFGGFLAKAAAGVPLVAGLRGADVNVDPKLLYGGRLQPSFDRSFRRLLRAADTTVSVSEFLRRRALELGAPPSTARVILKGVRLEQFAVPEDRQRARDGLGIATGPVILAVAGLVPIKGLTHVVESLAQVRASGREFSFIICGDGPDRAALEAQVDRSGLSGWVRFAGRVSRKDITTHFAAADLFVHGSLIEASGNVLLEAMASGLPIVCTDAGGPAEYVQDGMTGYVVPVADPEAMSQRVAQLIDDPNLRSVLGREGRRRAEALFSYDRMIDETLAVYQSLLAGGGRRSSGESDTEISARDRHVSAGPWSGRIMEAQTLDTEPSTSAARRDCPVCGSARVAHFLTATDNGLLRRTDVFLPVYRCRSCDVFFLNPPPPAEIGREYFADAYAMRTSNIYYDEEFKARTGQLRLELLSRYGVSGGKLLDVGCGKADFVNLARKGGWDAWGVELDAGACDLARKHFGLQTVLNGSMDHPDLPAQFDVITLWDVIEHVPDPVGVLRQAADRLRKGGIVMVRTANIRSWPFDRKRDRWWAFGSDHRFYFSPGSLGVAMKLGGLDVLDVLNREPAERPDKTGGRDISDTRLSDGLRSVSRSPGKIGKLGVYGRNLIRRIVGSWRYGQHYKTGIMTVVGTKP